MVGGDNVWVSESGQLFQGTLLCRVVDTPNRSGVQLTDGIVDVEWESMH